MVQVILQTTDFCSTTVVPALGVKPIDCNKLHLLSNNVTKCKVIYEQCTVFGLFHNTPSPFFSFHSLSVSAALIVSAATEESFILVQLLICNNFLTFSRSL